MTDRVSPLTLQMALAYACAPDPQEFFSVDIWLGEAAQSSRLWMAENGLLDTKASYRPTPKLHAWVRGLCSVPLPREEWVIDWPEGKG